MNFDDYTKLICSDITERGYDVFLPCACVPGDRPAMFVLKGELTSRGEEIEAGAWVAERFTEHSDLFFAFRAGGRRIHICWLQNAMIRERVHVQVEESEE
jgi:hypothetical protein